MFIRIPKDIILARELGKHRVEFFYVLSGNRNYFSRVCFSPESIILSLAYNPVANRSSPGGIYSQLTSFLEQMYRHGYLADEFLASKAKLKTHYELRATDKFEPEHYAIITADEMNELKAKPTEILILSLIRLLERNNIVETYIQSFESILGVGYIAINNALSNLAAQKYIYIKKDELGKTIIKDLKGVKPHVRQTDIS